MEKSLDVSSPNALATQSGSNWAIQNFDQMLKFAKTMIETGFLPKAITSPAQAVAIIITGQEMGIPPLQSLRQINVIQGKPTMGAELMLARARQKIPGLVVNILESTDKRCEIEFIRPGSKGFKSVFTMQDAMAMALDSRDSWKKQPATMLRWRCISAGLRVIAPDAVMGVYTPEELAPESQVDFDSGDVIDVRPDQIYSNPHVTVEVTQEPETPRPAPSEFISGPQQKRLFAILTESKVPEKELRDFMSSHLGITSTSSIKKPDFDQVIDWILRRENELKSK